MNNNKIENPKTEVPKGLDMNERDYLNAILESEKNMSNNLSIALNEASNEELFDKIYDIFDNIKTCARNAYRIMFQKGWYSLEKAEANKIEEKKSCLRDKMDNLEQ